MAYTFLLVEDQLWIRDETESILKDKDEGHQCYWTDAFTEALQIFQAKQIDVAIVDAIDILEKPYDLDVATLGCTLIGLLRQRAPNLPIVAMSIQLDKNFNSPPIDQQSLDAGADAFVESPPTKVDLLQAIEQAIRKHPLQRD